MEICISISTPPEVIKLVVAAYATMVSTKLEYIIMAREIVVLNGISFFMFLIF